MLSHVIIERELLSKIKKQPELLLLSVKEISHP